MTTELTLPQRAAVALKSAEHELALIELAAKSADIKEILNADGRTQAHSAGMSLRNTRTTISATGKAARDDATKFSKAIIEEENRLIALIEPEEKRVLALRDAWDAKIEAEKQAKIEANRQRIAAINESIASVKVLPTVLAGATSQKISKAMSLLVDQTDFESFSEFESEYRLVRSGVLERLAKMETEARAAECEADRLRQEAERQRLEQVERAEQVRIEQERIAVEQAKQRAELERQMTEMADKQRAESERIQSELAELARQKQEIADANAKLEAARQSAFDEKERAEALALQQADAAEKLFIPEESLKPAQTFETKLWPFPTPVKSAAEASASDALRIPTLRLGQIGEKLGFPLTAEFLRSLGFEHSAKDKSAMLYRDYQFPEICAVLVRHIQSCAQQKAA